jgi:hypothetical protein
MWRDRLARFLLPSFSSNGESLSKRKLRGAPRENRSITPRYRFAAIVFRSCRNASKSIPSVNCWMLSMASAMSRRALTASSKGKHGLALGSPAHRFLEVLYRGIQREKAFRHLSTFFAGEAEARLVDPSQIRFLESVGCTVAT